jgi:signal transduction histidine kinase
MVIADLLGWFAGGSHRYMPLTHCMDFDWPWIRLTVALDVAVATGYALIALHWGRNERRLPPSPAKAALGTKKRIFVFCGLCGYLFIPIKMYWPAWRLYDVFLVALVYYTWRYALGARHLRVIYEELGRSDELKRDLERSREEGRRKSYFLNAVSHDLKTPLNGLMLQAELAEMSLDADDPQALRESLAEIKGCARATADLLDRFLEIGRLDWSEEPSRLDRFDLDDLVRGVSGQVRARVELKGLRWRCEAPAGLAVRSDRVKVERIVLNLLDNAIKFTHEGEIGLRVEGDATDVKIRVTDTGEGIGAENQALIFDDFTQVHNRERDSRKGFGLGLAIARRLAEQIGADLAVESELGRGSRFTLRLPAAPDRLDDAAEGTRDHFLSGAATPARC